MIRVGIAGWDYPDWEGTVYPADAGRDFDRLEYVAGFVDVIEVNSTFYRPAAPRTTTSWLRRTERAPDLRFTAKVHRSLTHEIASDPAADAGPTLSGLRPLLDAGRLGALLLQYPQSVHFTPQGRARIAAGVACLDGWPIVVEVRHRSWECEEAATWLRERGAALCAVDQPAIGDTARLLPRVTVPPAYVRLHGRNVANWFRSDAGRDARYDYLYDLEQIAEVADAVRAMAQAASDVYVVQNNHFRGQALVNALQMKAVLQGVPPLAPDCLVTAYPHLGPQVLSDRPRLF